MDQTTADLHRRVANVAIVGTIAEVDHDRSRVRVDINGRLSDWLRWPADMGRNYRRWRPLRVGMQVGLTCPSGDPANACINAILHTSDLPPPSTDPDVDLIQWEDGTAVSYDTATQTMVITAVKTVRIQAETIEIDGRVIITGDRVEHNGRNIGDDHQHTNVKPGPSLTGPPAG